MEGRALRSAELDADVGGVADYASGWVVDVDGRTPYSNMRKDYCIRRCTTRRCVRSVPDCNSP